MQNRLWIGVLLMGLPSACVAGALASGCGGSSDDSNGSPDASQDVTAQDTSKADVVQIVDAGRCDDADLNTLSLPDAALGDAGASTGTCIGCTRTSCPGQVTACNKDCDCINAVDDALNCVAEKGGLDFSCAGGFLGNSTAQDLGTCIYAACQQACGLPAADAGGDAGDGG